MTLNETTTFKCATYLVFILNIQRAVDFIKNEDLGLSDKSASDSNALPLTLG